MKKSFNRLSSSQLKEFLDEKVELYNRPEFVATDPISIPHRFTLKEDIEIAGFFAATLAWGKRVSIISKSVALMEMMGNSPYDYVMHAKPEDINRLVNFVHRTFNGMDAQAFIHVLRKMYKNGGLYRQFSNHNNAFGRINAIHDFFEKHLTAERTLKHVSSPANGSAAKRINMFLRWMVRNDNRGVDFGIWKDFYTSTLVCPLDVHSGNVARKLGLLHRSQNDWKAALELTESLKKMDSADPVKYDFALFGLGVFEGF